ncbi:hypothetical protein GCM10020216_090490 [Nonomuraea helvata]
MTFWMRRSLHETPVFTEAVAARPREDPFAVYKAPESFRRDLSATGESVR